MPPPCPRDFGRQPEGQCQRHLHRHTPSRANPAALTIQRWNTGTSTLTLTPSGGFTGQIAFSCTGLPQCTSSSFTPAAVILPGDNAAHTVQFSLSTCRRQARRAQRSHSGPPSGCWLSSISRGAEIHGHGRSSRGFVASNRPCSPQRPSASQPCGSSRRQVPLGTSTVTMTAATVGGSTHRAPPSRSPSRSRTHLHSPGPPAQTGNRRGSPNVVWSKVVRSRQ